MPDFIDLLNTDSKQASDLFALWVKRKLSESPPRKIYSVAADDRQDVIQDIILHCINDDMKVLRQFGDHGRPFEAWFYWVARNKILDYLRKRRSGIQTTSVSISFDGGVESIAVPQVSPDSNLDSILRITNDCIKELGQKCRILLRMAGDEFRPREMARLLRMPKEKAKNISSDLRYCRKKLQELIKSRGVLIENVFGK